MASLLRLFVDNYNELLITNKGMVLVHNAFEKNKTKFSVPFSTQKKFNFTFFSHDW